MGWPRTLPGVDMAVAATGSFQDLVSKVVVGAHIQATTILDEVFEGEVYTHDVLTGCLVIQQKLAHTTLKCSMRFMNTNCIKEITIMPLDPPKSDGTGTSQGGEMVQGGGHAILSMISALPSQLPPVSERRLQEREREAHEKARQALAQLGHGVSAEAQLIFDSLCKTLPCTWDDADMIVLGQVRVVPPYTAESASSLDGNEGALARVRKVLAGERKRLSRTASAAATAAGAASS